MARYEHYLTPTKGDRYPAFVIGLAVASNAVVGVAGKETGELQLQTWGAVLYAKEHETYIEKYRGTGTETAVFWEGLQKPLAKGQETLVCCFGASEVWPLIGVWEQLENDTIAILGEERTKVTDLPSLPEVQSALGNDPGMDGGQTGVPQLPSLRNPEKRPNDHMRQGRQTRRRMDGSCTPVVEDPPSILWCYQPGLKGYMRWVDLKNYGITSIEQSSNTLDIAAAIATQMISLITLLESQALGSLQSTAAGQSLFSFRRKYLSTAILCHNNTTILKLESDSYVGGRCEAYRLGKIVGPVSALDFRSMYPSCYTGTALPCRLLDWYSGGTCRLEDLIPVQGSAIAAVDIETNEPAYPVKRDGLVIWPVGRFTTTLCGPELCDAISLGRIKKVHQFATYAMEKALSEYGEEFYRQRVDSESRQGNGSGEWCKRLLVAIVGKFGQREKRWIDVPSAEYGKPWGFWVSRDETGNWQRWRCLAWRVQKEIVGGFTNDAVPSIASWITSLGRMKLLHVMRVAGMENISYVDTDAIFVNAIGYAKLNMANLIRSNELGYLQKKAASDGCTIYGIKSYDLGGASIHAGIPQNARVTETGNMLYTRFAKTAEQIRKGTTPRAKQIDWRSNRSAPYRHGTVQEGGEIHPIVLEEW
jgi:DNA polymerase type B, organellar and viral.